MFSSVVRTPVLVVGSGVAGLSTALGLDECTVVTAGSFGYDGSTQWAQGGIAAVVDATDSVELHAKDTEVVSSGLTEREIVNAVTAGGPDAIERLMRWGARFDALSNGDFDLGKEAGHSARRIIKSNGDSIGKLIAETLTNAVAENNNITVLEQTSITSLAIDPDSHRVVGAVGATRDGGVLLLASEVVLATGGYSYLFEKTTNPAGSIGYGAYLAGSVGAELADMEFVQFHPTALDVGSEGRLPLITEAIRGEGARLVNSNGDRYMEAVHPDAELAPRDVVARANYRQITQGLSPALDATESLGSEFADHFPGVAMIAAEHGLDPSTEALPVTPAAHYCMGGIKTNETGQTSLVGLRAVGEAARSGLHGANRLASNSLLEGLVMGQLVADDISENLGLIPNPESVRIVARSHSEESQNPRSAEILNQVQDDVSLGQVQDDGMESPCQSHPDESQDLELELRNIMWTYVGLERNESDLIHAQEQIEALSIGASTQREQVLLYVASKVIRAALRRTESRGAHYRSDFPESGPEQSHSDSEVSELLTVPVSAPIRVG